MDSDDWVEPDMISSLYSKAKETNADIVCCDYFISYKNKEIYKNCIVNNVDCNYFEAILADYMPPFLWNKFCKKNIYNSVKFINTNFGSDHCIAVQLFFYAKKVSIVNKPYIYYNKENSFSIIKNSLIDEKNNLYKIRLLHDNLRQILIELEVWNKKTKSYYYLWLISIIMHRCSKNFKNNIKTISLEAYKFKYILDNKKYNFYTKIAFLIAFLGFDSIYISIRNLYRNHKGKK